jgi:hypothetical protein
MEGKDTYNPAKLSGATLPLLPPENIPPKLPIVVFNVGFTVEIS